MATAKKKEALKSSDNESGFYFGETLSEALIGGTGEPDGETQEDCLTTLSGHVVRGDVPEGKYKVYKVELVGEYMCEITTQITKI